VRVIVICESCDTRFQLDEARVPASGARVRCSRCKHAFLVLPPDAREDDTVHAIAAAAAERPEPTPPSVTEDLAGPLSPETQGATEEESEWQFAENDQPAREESREQPPEPVEDLWQGVLEEEKPPEALELDALGNPESWSFVSQEATPLRPPRAAAPAEAGAPLRSATAPVPIARIALVRASDVALAENVPESVAPNASGLVDRVGWAVTGLLLLALIHGIDWGRPASAAVIRSFALQDGLVVEDLSLRRVENLVAGPVLVVTGTVTNSGTAPAGSPSRLWARVAADAGNRTADAEAVAPRTPQTLRESAPERAGAVLAPLLGNALEPGARIPFEAVFPGPPPGDARLELRLEPLKGSERSGEVEGGAPATGEASPPAPLPSSG
jgi:predicted Zn finger-like uncharacterized protein